MNSRFFVFVAGSDYIERMFWANEDGDVIFDYQSGVGGQVAPEYEDKILAWQTSMALVVINLIFSTDSS